MYVEEGWIQGTYNFALWHCMEQQIGKDAVDSFEFN